MNRINIIRFGKSWRLLISGRQRAYKVISDSPWGGNKKLSLWEAKQIALRWAVNHVPADVILHKEDGTVDSIIKMKEKI